MRIIPTDTRMKQKTGAAIQNRAVPLQACGPHEPHPRQVDILLDNGMLVTCKILLVHMSPKVQEEQAAIELPRRRCCG